MRNEISAPKKPEQVRNVVWRGDPGCIVCRRPSSYYCPHAWYCSGACKQIHNTKGLLGMK